MTTHTKSKDKLGQPVCECGSILYKALYTEWCLESETKLSELRRKGYCRVCWGNLKTAPRRRGRECSPECKRVWKQDLMRDVGLMQERRSSRWI